MSHYDLCLPWYWEYDYDFVQMVARSCEQQNVSFLPVTPQTLLEHTTALYLGDLTLGALLDRSQDDRRFEPLIRWAREHFIRRINPAEVSAWSEDKATMHLELIQAGLNTPYTLLLPSFIDEPVIPARDIAPLGGQFVIKPSNGGGGEGVIMGAASWQDILNARLEFPSQKYLAQATIQPASLDGRPAWFRIFYAHGQCFPCWWDPGTHIYGTLTSEEEALYALAPLRLETLKIANICRLDWFSTEIALAGDRFVVVDYVNDGIDTRIQSRALDGVPDLVMQSIAEQLVRLIAEKQW